MAGDDQKSPTIKSYYRDQNECGEAMNKSLIRNKKQIIAENPKTRTLDCWIKVTSKNQNSNNILRCLDNRTGGQYSVARQQI